VLAKIALQSYLCVMPDSQLSLGPHNLRGIAHPLRVRLLNLLREYGPSTATRLAERTSQSSGATSYHLRQLAQYGFVEPDPAREGGRERWWRATTESTTLAVETYREAPVETEAYLRGIAADYADRVDRWLNQMDMLGDFWDDGATLSNWRFKLTPAEAAQLLQELHDVIDRYRKDPAGTVDGPEGSERVDLQLALLPFVEGGRS
jgi:DNA-binding MarR family transcriptional regulator